MVIPIKVTITTWKAISGNLFFPFLSAGITRVCALMANKMVEINKINLMETTRSIGEEKLNQSFREIPNWRLIQIPVTTKISKAGSPKGSKLFSKFSRLWASLFFSTLGRIQVARYKCPPTQIVAARRCNINNKWWFTSRILSSKFKVFSIIEKWWIRFY